MTDDWVLVTTDIDTGAVLAVDLFDFSRRFQSLGDQFELPVAAQLRVSEPDLLASGAEATSRT